MKILIHRGTNQIGGCITEISSNAGTKIIIDIGANLPNAERIKKLELEIDGLTKGKAKYDAILITHYHGDHIGLYNKILPEIPIYIGAISKEIFNILQERLSMADLVTKKDLEVVKRFHTFQIPNKIKIGDILVTPIAVDHSAFDAYMFLIECDGKKLLHTGDFRLHGQRGKSVLKALEKYIGKIDCLICEGTSLARKPEVLLTEGQLQKKAEEIFKNNKYNFVLCSSTNIDRIAALHKASIKENRMFIGDSYQVQLLEYINSISRASLYKFNNSKDTKVYEFDFNLYTAMKERGFVMLIRPNKLTKKILKEFPESTFIYSEWLGYLSGTNEDYKKIQEIVPKNYIYLHTSGHATPEAIKQIIALTQPKVVIPIHTEDKEKIKELTDKAVILEDNEEVVL